MNFLYFFSAVQPPAITFSSLISLSIRGCLILCFSSLLLHRQHNKVTHREQKKKNPIAIVTSEPPEPGRLSRGPQKPAFLPSCQAGLNTVFSVVTQRHTITVIDVELCTSTLNIVSRRSSVMLLHKTSSPAEDAAYQERLRGCSHEELSSCKKCSSVTRIHNQPVICRLP